MDSNLDDLLTETTNLPAFDPATEQKARANKRQRPGDAPSTATAGWGFGNSDGSQPVLSRPTELGKPSKSRHHHADDGEDDVIPVIPDLEEEGEEEDITRQVANPHIGVGRNRLPSIASRERNDVLP